MKLDCRFMAHAVLAVQIFLAAGCATILPEDNDVKYSPALRFEYSIGEYLNYEKRGSGRIPLVLLHGFGCSLRNWDDVVAEIEARTDLRNAFSIYALDLKGAGFSSKPDGSDYSIADNAAAVADFIEKLDLRGAVIAGHSLGGGVALHSTVEELRGSEFHPAALLLIDTACYPTDLPFFISFLRIPLLNRVLLSGLPPEFIARRVLSEIMAPGTPITPELIKRYAFFASLPGRGRALIETAANILPDNADELVNGYQDVSCPTIILWGELDSVLPLSLGERLSDDMPNSELVVLRGCGHDPPEERPAEVAEALAKLLNRLGEGAGGKSP